MGEQQQQENFNPLPATATATARVSKKRDFASMATHNHNPPPSETRKRVALAELTNACTSSFTGEFAHHSDLTSAHKPKTTKKKVSVLESLKKQTHINITSDPPSHTNKSDYAPIIYQHLRLMEAEEKRRPLSNYIEKIQKDISPVMREILVSWLVEVAEEYKLVSDTLFLTVSYVDRFLSAHALSRNNLQLLGVSSMLAASKHEEISPPHVEDFCYITDNTYTKDEVVNMERDLLKFLNFEMGNPTTKTFLRIFTRAAQENSTFNNLELEFLGSYLAELSLLDYCCVQFLQSMVAASAIFISLFTLRPTMHPWSLALQQCSGYRPSDLKQCVLFIHDLQLNRKGISLQAVRDKYMQHKKFLPVTLKTFKFKRSQLSSLNCA